MDKLVRARKPVRAAATRLCNELTKELAEESPDQRIVKVKFQLLEDVVVQLTELDGKILDDLLDGDSTDEQFEVEFSSIDDYKQKFTLAKYDVQTFLEPRSRSVSPTGSASDFDTASAGSTQKRNVKLPKIELKKFDGDLSNWLGFWSQFRNIHEDDSITTADKFQYLMQSMVPGSRAKELVSSYPQTAENYQKAIAALQGRFGKTDLLIEFYVRELLKLVINNSTSPKKQALSKSFDKLETQLRALESLGVTTDKNAAMLYPLVESGLSEDVLRAWQRSSLAAVDGSKLDPPRSRLQLLLDFMKNEVESEERITLAQAGFGSSTKHRSSSNKPEVGEHGKLPIAAGLFSGQQSFSKPICIFCNKVHESKDCLQAQKMTFAEKQDILKKVKCCFICLRPSHMSKSCKAAVRCIICGEKHQPIMCKQLHIPKEKPVSATETKSKKDGPQIQTGLQNQMCSGFVQLQTLVVRILGEGKEIRARAVMDIGSQKTHILENTARDLNYPIMGEEIVEHLLFGGKRTEPQTHKKYQISLGSVQGDFECTLNVLDQPKICGILPRAAKGAWLKYLSRIGVEISDRDPTTDPEIQVLIGADYYGRLLTGRIESLKCGLTAIETKLGWTLTGPVPKVIEKTSSMLVTSMLLEESSVTDLWRLDAIGIKDPAETLTKQERDECARQHFLNTVSRQEDGRYEVSLPWIERRPSLPDNHSVSETRLSNVSKKLRSLGRWTEYNQIFQEWIEEGFIEEVPATEINSPCHYLPHRPVYKESSLTFKVRPVFDASCKVGKNPSLNNCLEKGPNLLELMPAILLRFRENKIGLIADIRKAFPQIAIRKEDREYLRFLWESENSSKKSIKVFRHLRVVFGVTCSPFLLAAVIEHHLKNAPVQYQKTANLLQKSFYVDNCVLSVRDEDAMHEVIKDSVSYFADAKMDLRLWESNFVEDSGIGSHISCGRGLESGEANSIYGESTRVLGLKWNKVEDTLSCDINVIECPSVITKRSILSIAQKIFDPLGFVSPATLEPKLLLQETWAEKVSWDVELSEEVKARFQKWFSELHLLQDIRIPRWITSNGGDRNTWSLHTFCDASSHAYAVVIYLRSETENGTCVQLVQSKVRVAPIKRVTIPRLELLACTVASRLADSIIKALDLQHIRKYYWSDSTTALAWIRRYEDWGTFVGNRVQEIRQLTNPDSWRHVRGKDNPADLPSRGCSVKQLIQSRWWEGPVWLKHLDRDLPNSESGCDEAAVSSERKTSLSSLLHQPNVNANPWYGNYFSSYSKIVRMVAWILRFVNNSAKRRVRSGQLSLEEMDKAEVVILKEVQQQCFQETNSLAHLDIVKDEAGLIRLKSRISRRDDSHAFRYPIILPSKFVIVEKIVRETHLKNSHAGVQVLMIKLREKFWILQSRRVIRSIIGKCSRCKRYQVKKVESEPTALPLNRVRDAAVFEVSGIDLAGPLYLKDNSKVWIVLFTCAIYRAVHLELVSSLSTECFLQSLRRFIARRGRPRTIYTDNGTNFVGFENATRALNWEEITAQTSIEKIEWIFNPPSAAWWGGWWERLVQMVKRLLVRVLGKASLQYEELGTVLCDVESVINSRPLTYVSEDSQDLMPLCPKMFLQEVAESGIPDLDQLNSEGFQKRFRYRQKIREDLRRRFRDEYLSQLVQRSKEKATTTVKVGDVVLVGSDNKKRLEWPLGRVMKVVPGNDGKVRVAIVKTQHGELVRPIQRLFPLEVNMESDLDGGSSSAPNTTKKITTRSGREVKVPLRFHNNLFL